MQIEGARALVGGGASGLGAATARRLLAAGAPVTIADVNADAGAALAAELGDRAAFARCDVTDAAAVDEAVLAARAAGAADRGHVRGRRLGREDRRQARPARGRAVPQGRRGQPARLLPPAARRGAAMLGNEPDAGGERGVIVMTASIAAYDGQIGQIAYAASKGGVVGMTLPAARDLAANRIRVCTIAPGLFDTPLLAGLPEEARAALGAQVPHPARLGAPDEYAALAAHIVENPMLNGEVIRLDGALRMPPR